MQERPTENTSLNTIQKVAVFATLFEPRPGSIFALKNPYDWIVFTSTKFFYFPMFNFQKKYKVTKTEKKEMVFQFFKFF